MKALKKLATYYRLFTKRLLKRPVFTILILLVPLLCAALAAASRMGSGVVTVGLVCETDEPAAQRCIERVTSLESLVRIREYDSEEAARADVAAGELDAAWIFEKDLAATLERYAKGKTIDGVVTIVEREETIFLMMARELLAGSIYPEASIALFRDHLTKTFGLAEDTPWEYFEPYYRTDVHYQSILVFQDIDGDNLSTGSFLVSPLRGILSLLLVLTGLASAAYYCKDTDSGLFDRLRKAQRRVLPFFSHLCALLPVALAVLLALEFTGLSGGFGEEALTLLCYCLALAAFCELLRRLCRSEAMIGALTPVLLIAFAVLCPIFIDLDLRPVQLLLPTFHYLLGNSAALLLYGAAAFTAAVLLPE